MASLIYVERTLLRIVYAMTTYTNLLTILGWTAPAFMMGRRCEPKRYGQGRPPAWLALQTHRRNRYLDRRDEADLSGMEVPSAHYGEVLRAQAV